VSKAVKVLTFFDTSFAIRSGGHTPFQGSSSIDGGVLIALDKFNTVSLSKAMSIASIGVGNRWGTVYEQLRPYDLAAVGGRVPPVGVGGLTLGGGLSYFSGVHGLACDNVKNYQVVLADGRIVNVNAEEHRDLFKALKGGTNNFGIVTRIDVNTVPISREGVWGGTYFYEGNTTEEFAKAMVEYQMKYQPADLKTHVLGTIAFVAAGMLRLSFASVFHPDTVDPPSLKVFSDIPSLGNTTQRRTLRDTASDVFGQDSAEVVPPFRQDFRTISLAVSKELYQDIIALFYETYPKIAEVAGLQTTMTWQPVAANVAREGKKRGGGNSLGLEEVAQTWLIVNCAWALQSDDKKALRTQKAFVGQVEKMASKRGLLHKFRYLNDAAMDQDPIARYGRENIGHLWDVSKRYDPEGVFQRLVGGGFKLPKKF